MGNYEQLKQSVSDVIKTNGNQEITGSILQNVLLTIISSVGANATFAGIATPTTNPGTPDGPVFYLASESGTYTNFGGITLTDEVAIFQNANGTWVKSDTGIATSTKVAELERKTSEISKEVIKTTDDLISIEDDNGDEVFRLDKNGLNAKEVKSNGEKVLTKQDISSLATKEDVDKKQDVIPQVSQEKSTTIESEQIWGSDDGTDEYAKIGNYGIKAKDFKNSEGVSIQEKVIIVDKNGNGNYNSLTQCFNDYKNDNCKKVIYIQSGEYDIFEELGGEAFIETISDPSSANWRDVNALVPPNTRLIGRGDVLLKFSPTFAQMKNSHEMCFLFSVLNISHDCYIENISLEGKNCRYVIHDEQGNIEKYKNAIHEYVNVRAHKSFSDEYVNQLPQVFGSGIGANSRWIFKNCEFRGDTNYELWSCHTNGNRDAINIVFDNCIIEADSAETMKNNSMVYFISNSDSLIHNRVKFTNCIINGKIRLNDAGNHIQDYDLTLINTKVSGITIDDSFTTNVYNIKIY